MRRFNRQRHLLIRKRVKAASRRALHINDAATARPAIFQLCPELACLVNSMCYLAGPGQRTHDTRQDAAPYKKPRLVVTSRRWAGSEWLSPVKGMRIGRDCENNDVVLDDATNSGSSRQVPIL